MGDLPVYRDDDGQNVSCWELSAEDIKTILDTGKIWLYVWADSHPPVSVVIEDPFAPVEADNVG